MTTTETKNEVTITMSHEEAVQLAIALSVAASRKKEYLGHWHNHVGQFATCAGLARIHQPSDHWLLLRRDEILKAGLATYRRVVDHYGQDALAEAK